MTREEAEKVMHTAKYILQGLMAHYGIAANPETMAQAAWNQAQTLHKIKEQQ